MYNDPKDTTGNRAFNAMKSAIISDFIAADTVDVSNVTEWQREYKRIAGHNASHTCYITAISEAELFFYTGL